MDYRSQAIRTRAQRALLKSPLTPERKRFACIDSGQRSIQELRSTPKTLWRRSKRHAFGRSGHLQERITITGGEVQQSNFYDYKPLRISAVPEIEVQIIESGAPPSGAGEIGVPMTEQR
ncbi:hypothetical protein [Sinorhizobium meliloti]|uniref:hypothetical protein n=1 Tax=Rhizobium meliloti TaxID=382 RepID=UPI003F16FF81